MCLILITKAMTTNTNCPFLGTCNIEGKDHTAIDTAVFVFSQGQRWKAWVNGDSMYSGKHKVRAVARAGQQKFLPLSLPWGGCHTRARFVRCLSVAAATAAAWGAASSDSQELKAAQWRAGSGFRGEAQLQVGKPAFQKVTYLSLASATLCRKREHPSSLFLWLV